MREEAQDGLDRNILVPAKIEDVALPLGFRTVQTVDLCGWQGEVGDPQLVSLLEDIASLLGEVSIAVESAPPSPGADAPPSPTRGRGSGMPATHVRPEQPKPLPPGEVGAHAPGEGAAAPKPADQTPTAAHIHIGVDPCTLPDLAIFKDINAPWCPEMVIIPAGSFLMGSSQDERIQERYESPQHRVAINQRFALGRYAVTSAEYDYFCEATHRAKPRDAGRGQRPVFFVSWSDVKVYLHWLVSVTGHPYRLPSEAEWEYACRAGTTTRFSCGNSIRSGQEVQFNKSKIAKAGDSGQFVDQTVEVGSFAANPWGLHEMHGNVWEWVEDIWHDDYFDAPNDGSPWADSDEEKSNHYRVIRGGSWNSPDLDCRSASRSRDRPFVQEFNFGFRLARTFV